MSKMIEAEIAKRRAIFEEQATTYRTQTTGTLRAIADAYPIIAKNVELELSGTATDATLDEQLRRLSGLINCHLTRNLGPWTLCDGMSDDEFPF